MYKKWKNAKKLKANISNKWPTKQTNHSKVRTQNKTVIHRRLVYYSVNQSQYMGTFHNLYHHQEDYCR